MRVSNLVCDAVIAWERLRGTPACLEERVRDLSHGTLSKRIGDAWSIQEQFGHLSDLEPLWYGRVEDLSTGRAQLRTADLTNSATWEAGRRAKLVLRLESLNPLIASGLRCIRDYNSR